MKKILVTGGTGFIGAACTRRLVSNGYTVRILDNGFRSDIETLKDLNVEIIEGDIRDSQVVFQAIEGMDGVIHLAAINATEFFYSKPALVLDVGIRGILNVIDGCIKHSVKNLLVASSSEVYQTPSKYPADETECLKVPDVLNPRYSYGGSKIMTELLTFNYGRTHFERAIVFRPHNVYGLAMGWEHVIPQFILRAANAIQHHSSDPVPFPVQGTGMQTRAFVHIDDMIDGMMLLLEKGEHLNVYHIGNPEEITIGELAQKVVGHFGRTMQLKPDTLPQGCPERRCPNIDKMKQLGFSPRISLDQGLPEVIDWYVKAERKIVTIRGCSF
jgi:dTDP-glucose 4,6-dehydratase/UDP-glucose 4-epimerase